MDSKNIKLTKKHGISIIIISDSTMKSNAPEKKMDMFVSSFGTS